MANATVAQAVNRQNVAQALTQARRQCAQHVAWLTALNKAALNLEACTWQFDGETLVIASGTTQGSRYTVGATGCGCKAHKAGRPCWHRAARRLLVKAAALNTQPVPAHRFSLTMAELEAAADELLHKNLKGAPDWERLLTFWRIVR